MTEINPEKQIEDLRPLPFFGSETWRGQAAFYLRIFFDLRLNAIYDHAQKLFPQFSGRVLDIGCGGQPWRWMLKSAQAYLGLDLQEVNEKFGYLQKSNMAYYNGRHFPLKNESFDHIICTEVLEHVLEPEEFLKECHRCLKKGGTLFLTVPFSARYHYIPHDFWRFTPAGLKVLFERVGLSSFQLHHLGTDASVIISKINLLILKLLLPSRGGPVSRLIKIFFGMMLLPLFFALTVLGLLFIKFDVGSRDDPLGYAVVAKKS